MPSNGQAQSPMFLGIGAQRSGSTWLHQNLQAHKEIWLTPIKEVHYFDRLREGPFLCEEYKRRLKIRAGKAKASLLSKQWPFANFWWDLKFFCMPRSDRWYSSLFPAGKTLVTGDITPAYSTLSGEVVSMIKEMNPNVKVIFLMRDPIDRSWSQAKRELHRLYGKPLKEIPPQEVIHWFNEPACALRSDYVRTLDIWQAHFPKAQFFFGFLEEINANPRDLLLRVFDFLGVERSDKYVPESAHAIVNSRGNIDIAPVYEYELARIHEPMLARLTQMFDSYPAQWHQRCVKILEQQGRGDPQKNRESLSRSEIP